MKLYRAVVAVIIIAIILSLSGCETFRNVSKSDPYFKDKIGQSVCSTGDLYIRHWRADDVSFPEFQEYTLYTTKWSFSAVVPKGTGFTIEKVYYYNKISHLGHLVMARTSDLQLGMKLVEISSIFDPYGESDLLTEYGEFCD